MANVAATSLYHDTFRSRDFERVHNARDTELEKTSVEHDSLTIDVATLADIPLPGAISIHEDGEAVMEDTVVWVDSIPLSVEVNPVEVTTTSTTQVPFVLRGANTVLGLATLFFTLQFVLAFFNAAWINGLVAFVAGVGSFGLFRVFNKAANVIKNKQYEQLPKVSG